jgi:hypothetical protein
MPAPSGPGTSEHPRLENNSNGLAMTFSPGHHQTHSRHQLNIHDMYDVWFQFSQRPANNRFQVPLNSPGKPV